MRSDLSSDASVLAEKITFWLRVSQVNTGRHKDPGEIISVCPHPPFLQDRLHIYITASRKYTRYPKSFLSASSALSAFAMVF